MGLFTKNYPPEIAPRIPPGQRLVKTWPVLHYGPIPTFDGAHWDLEVSGLVANPFTLSYDELLGMPMIERDITMTCVSNEVGGGYVGAARWLGVRLTDVLDRAGVGSRSDQILSTAVDGFTISTPLAMIGSRRSTSASPTAVAMPTRLPSRAACAPAWNDLPARSTPTRSSGSGPSCSTSRWRSAGSARRRSAAAST